MVITEIFKSIQGEGTRAGLPCIFVRLTGCNLRCTWCDTAYAFHGGKKMSVEKFWHAWMNWRDREEMRARSCGSAGRIDGRGTSVAGRNLSARGEVVAAKYAS